MIKLIVNSKSFVKERSNCKVSFIKEQEESKIIWSKQSSLNSKNKLCEYISCDINVKKLADNKEILSLYKTALNKAIKRDDITSVYIDDTLGNADEFFEMLLNLKKKNLGSNLIITISIEQRRIANIVDKRIKTNFPGLYYDFLTSKVDINSFEALKANSALAVFVPYKEVLEKPNGDDDVFCYQKRYYRFVDHDDDANSQTLRVETLYSPIQFDSKNQIAIPLEFLIQNLLIRTEISGLSIGYADHSTYIKSDRAYGNCSMITSLNSNYEIDYDKDKEDELIYSFFKGLLKGAEKDLALNSVKGLFELRSRNAHHFLGVLYRLGHGVEKDNARYIAEMEKAAMQACQAADLELSNIYFMGDDPKNINLSMNLKYRGFELVSINGCRILEDLDIIANAVIYATERFTPIMQFKAIRSILDTLLADKDIEYYSDDLKDTINKLKRNYESYKALIRFDFTEEVR